MPERALTYAAALNEALRQELRRDPSVFLLGEDIAAWGDGGGVFGVTKGLADEFGTRRVRDTPISEEAIVGLAVGAALAGMRPVAELMYFDFVTLAMEPLVNQAAKLRYMSGGQARVPLVVRSNVGASGGKAAQHSQSLESWVAHVPGLKVAMPSTPYAAKGLLIAAIRDDDPVVFLEHKLLYAQRGPVPEEAYALPFGRAEIVRAGRDVTVVAGQTMRNHALAAAEELAESDVEIEVIDPQTLVPLDVETIVESVRRTHRLVICHEAPRRGGFGAEIGLRVVEEAFDELDAPVVRVCGADVPIPYSEPLERAVLPSAESIRDAILSLLGREVAGGRRGAPSATAATSGERGAAVVLPRMSDSMVSGRVVRWLKQCGETVEPGEPLVEVETDKVTIVIEADESGVLAEIVFAEDAEAPVGAVLASIARV
jgi:pyruvate dehydrogenase E1 component beta subunit